MLHQITDANDIKPAPPRGTIDYLMTSRKGIHRLDAWRTSAVIAAFASKGQAVCEKDFDVLHVKGKVPLAVNRDWFRENLHKLTLIKIKATARVADDLSGHYPVSLTDSEIDLARSVGERLKFAVVDLEKRSHRLWTLREMLEQKQVPYKAWSFAL